MTDNELLVYMRKLIEQKSETLQGRTAWQEHLSKHTVVSAKSIQASEVIRGFSGSWASIYSAFPSDSRKEKIADPRTPANPSREYFKLGQAGVPEINFAPYDHNTNRFGTKGTSLIGHPISFEVVGSSVKSSANDWQWVAKDNTALGSGVGDSIAMDLGSSIASPSGVVAPLTGSVEDAYGLDSVNLPNGGLYLVISHTGESPPQIDGANDCGLGDGYIANDGVAPLSDPTKPREAVTAQTRASKFEVFRVTGIDNNEIFLCSNKRLADYFNFNGTKTNIIRSITLLTPRATRLVTVPQSGSLKGKERAFVVVPPSTSLSGDLQPPYDGGTSGDGSWLQGGFEPQDSGLLGVADDYVDNMSLPIPRVLRILSGELEKFSQALPQTANRSRIFDATLPSQVQVGQIIHIVKKETEKDEDLPVSVDPFGWFEILSTEVDHIVVRHLTTVDVKSGVKSYRPILVDDSGSVGDTYKVTFHLHDPISVLHTNNFDVDAVEYAKLDTLIDPSWVKTSGKSLEVDQDTIYSRADRAIFDTTSTNGGVNATNANPGSLLDLGFRMVFYPAKDDGGNLVADFDKPITSREVLLDETVTDEEQFIFVDYSNGLVILSHEPLWNVAGDYKCEVNPNNVGDNGRVVLFACCVPYSRELGQLGSSVRVTASVVDVDNDLEEHGDIYGERVSFDIKGTYGGLVQTVDSQVINSILVLASEDINSQLPESGYFEILHSADTIGSSNHPVFTVVDTGGVERRVSTFVYHSKSVVSDSGTDYTALHGFFGGGASGDSFSTSGLDGEYKIILRKNIQPLCDNEGVCGVPYQEDTTHGFAKRFDVLRFKDASIIQNKDGSITVETGVSGSGSSTPSSPSNLVPLSGNFVLVPKGPTSENGSGESRWYLDGTEPEVENVGDHPSDMPLYEFSGGYGRGYLKKGFPIKPGSFFSFDTSGNVVPTPPSEESFVTDIEFFNLLATGYLPFNSDINSGNLCVGYRHSNSRESVLYTSQFRPRNLSFSQHRENYRKSMKQQMRLLDGMIIENVTNGTFYTVGGMGTNTSKGITRVTSLNVDTTVGVISDGDTFYISTDSLTKTEFVFRNTPNPVIPEEVLIGANFLDTVQNLVLVANNHPNAILSNWKFSLDIEYYYDLVFLHIYSNETPTSIGPTVVSGYGNVYNDGVDFTGYYGVGGSIVGDSVSTAPFVQKESTTKSTTTDYDLQFQLSLSAKDRNILITSGDRASLFWTFYDSTKIANLNIKDKVSIGYYDLDGTVYLHTVLCVVSTDLLASLKATCDAINTQADGDYTTSGFPTTYGKIEARVVHVEEGTTFNRYAIEIRAENTGNYGNRWFIADISDIGATDLIPSLITTDFNHYDLLDQAGSFWTTNAAVGGGTYNTYDFGGGNEGWFLTGGLESEINYDLVDHNDFQRLPNQTGYGDRTDNDLVRKPLAGHHYRVVPNVEFVPVVGETGVNGGLLPPYTDPADSSTTILNADAILYDTEYSFTGSEVGSKVYLCGTDRFAYVGWWEIIGLIPNYTLPNNVDQPPSLTVAIVKKVGVGARSSSNDERIYGESTPTNRGQLPLTYRSPVVRMGMDTLTNGQGGMDNHEYNGFFEYWDKVDPADVSYSDLSVTIQLAIEGVADKVQQEVIPKNDLATGDVNGTPSAVYIVDSADKLALFCNADDRTNGTNFVFSDGSTGVAFLKWVVEKSNEYPKGCALYVTYDLSVLNVTQIDSLLGVDGILQINFFSRQDGMFFMEDGGTFGPDWGVNERTAIGFVSHMGHNSEFDTCLGDRNSFFAINPFEVVASGIPPADGTKTVYTATMGLRWVISEPLEDSHNGSYLHVTKENPHVFNGLGWNHQQSLKLTPEYTILENQDIYRINKCPSTKQLLLGGDVEVFHTEINGVINEEYSVSEPLRRHPIAYSSLGLMGTWKDSQTGVLPSTESRNYSPTYVLQLVNEERIVNISPTSMVSNTLFGSQLGTTETGTGGLGTSITTTSTPQAVLGAETPFKLFSRSNVQRSNVWGSDALGISLSNGEETRSERELWNSDNILGKELTYEESDGIPYYYYSLYSWTPNGSWWQTQMPTIIDNDQVDASTPPPTLRVDLTEQFSQILNDNSVSGVRLNKLWVNFGLWGDPTDSQFSGSSNTVAGLPQEILEAVLNKPAQARSNALHHTHMAFNLVLEIPSTQKNRFNLSKDKAILKVIGSVGSGDLGNTFLSVNGFTFVACSPNDVAGSSVPIPDYGILVGNYVATVWTPFTGHKLARAIATAINLAYKNETLTPSGADLTTRANSLYDAVYIEDFSLTQLSVSLTGAVQAVLNFPYNQQGFLSSGGDNLLFGDRSATASSSNMMNLDSVEPIKSIVIPLYVNREGGEVMPNTMEQMVDVGMGRHYLGGASVASDWNVGDPEYGFGFSDYPNYNLYNGFAFTDNITKTLYGFVNTFTTRHSKNALIGNPITPVVWGGMDFDSANNNHIQKSSDTYEDQTYDSFTAIDGDTYSGWDGKFTAPFGQSRMTLAQASMHPRMSRLSGGIREEFSTGHVINGDMLSRNASNYPFESNASLSANAMTGIVISHSAFYPASSQYREGSEHPTNPATFGTDPVRIRNSKSSGHAFTIALTPMAQKFDAPVDSKGRRSSVGQLLGVPFNTTIDEKQLPYFGRHLDPNNIENRVGNWLGEILKWSGIENTNGSFLPQGARVFLEVSTNMGNVDSGISNNGVWVGSVKCSFDVETNYGTAQTDLGEE